MSITKEHAKDAIKRFCCSIDQEYPTLDQMCFVETFEGKAGKELAELYGFTRTSIEKWINTKKHTGKVNNPATGADFQEVVPTLIAGKDLFALVLAIVEAAGHMQAVIEEDDEFSTFSKTDDYRNALNRGRTLLYFLIHATTGAELGERLQQLGVPNFGHMAQVRLLEDTLKFKPHEFAHYSQMGEELPADVRPPLEAKVDRLIPPGAPPQAVIHFGAGVMPEFDPFSPFAQPIGGLQGNDAMLFGAAPY